MYYTIYKITNLINNKIYIGKHQTNNIDDNYFGSGKYLKRAISKHGIENFTKEILNIYDSEAKMDLAEKILVVLDREVSYNLCSGGNGGFGYININSIPKFKGKRHSEETKEKIRQKSLGRMCSEETKQKLSKHFKITRKSKKNFFVYKDAEILEISKTYIKEYKKLGYKIKRKSRIVSEKTKENISIKLKEMWNNGSRKKLNINWNELQKDLDLGYKPKFIQNKYSISKNTFDHAIRSKYVRR